MDRDDKPLIDWGVLSAIAALVVAFGALAYVLGLLAMWFPASKETQDFALSWYATSLVPQTTVAGIGVRWSLVGSHLLFVFSPSTLVLGAMALPFVRKVTSQLP